LQGGISFMGYGVLWYLCGGTLSTWNIQGYRGYARKLLPLLGGWTTCKQNTSQNGGAHSPFQSNKVLPTHEISIAS
jgi:hypothetical protein